MSGSNLVYAVELKRVESGNFKEGKFTITKRVTSGKMESWNNEFNKSTSGIPAVPVGPLKSEESFEFRTPTATSRGTHSNYGIPKSDDIDLDGAKIRVLRLAPGNKFTQQG